MVCWGFRVMKEDAPYVCRLSFSPANIKLFSSAPEPVQPQLTAAQQGAHTVTHTHTHRHTLTAGETQVGSGAKRLLLYSTDEHALTNTRVPGAAAASGGSRGKNVTLNE